MDRSMNVALRRSRQKGEGFTMEEAATKAGTDELRSKLDALNKEVAAVARLMKERVVVGTKEWATEHPAAAIGIVAGVAASIGFIVGLFVGRGRN